MLTSAGIEFVIRYLSPDSPNNPDKRLLPIEVDAIHDAGLRVGCVWETTNDPGLFSMNTGRMHAVAASAVALALHQPSGSAIYFAVDVDVDQETLDAGVTDYFTAIKLVLDADGYKVGVYGSGQVCRHLRNAHLVDLVWLSQSMGWSQSRDCSNAGDWDIRQGLGSVCGLSSDPDECKDITLCGLW